MSVLQANTEELWKEIRTKTYVLYVDSSTTRWYAINVNEFEEHIPSVNLRILKLQKEKIAMVFCQLKLLKKSPIFICYLSSNRLSNIDSTDGRSRPEKPPTHLAVSLRHPRSPTRTLLLTLIPHTQSYTLDTQLRWLKIRIDCKILSCCLNHLN